MDGYTILAGALIFFGITNFAVWFINGYDHNGLDSLIEGMEEKMIAQDMNICFLIYCLAKLPPEPPTAKESIKPFDLRNVK